MVLAIWHCKWLKKMAAVQSSEPREQKQDPWCPLQSNLQNTGAIQMFLWNLEFWVWHITSTKCISLAWTALLLMLQLSNLQCNLFCCSTKHWRMLMNSYGYWNRNFIFCMSLPKLETVLPWTGIIVMKKQEALWLGWPGAEVVCKPLGVWVRNVCKNFAVILKFHTFEAAQPCWPGKKLAASRLHCTNHTQSNKKQ